MSPYRWSYGALTSRLNLPTTRIASRSLIAAAIARDSAREEFGGFVGKLRLSFVGGEF
jgi:hypothetical protein